MVKFGYTIGRIQHIDIVRRIDMLYTALSMKTQTVACNLTSFQGLKRCIQYMDSHPYKPIFYPSNSYDGSNVTRLTWIGNKVEYYITHNCL